MLYSPLILANHLGNKQSKVEKLRLSTTRRGSSTTTEARNKQKNQNTSPTYLMQAQKYFSLCLSAESTFCGATVQNEKK